MCVHKIKHLGICRSVLQNNYGALLLVLNQQETGVHMLERALELDPGMENAMVNLGSHYQDEGLLTLAEDLFRRAANVSAQARLLHLRIALLLSPVVASWEEMVTQRNRLVAGVKDVISSGPPPAHLLSPLDSSMDRIHFYIVYSGLNDKVLQQDIARMYQLNIRNLSKTCKNAVPSFRGGNSNDDTNDDQSETPPRRMRVGFLSKFFGVYEPHGMLLEGVMRYLPREMFEVLALPVVISDKPLSPIVENSVDDVVFITLEHTNAFNQICDLQLDILVFADTLSEPMTHFLAHSRMATIQVAFWGNPVTSGSSYIDYFVSADFMEHPYRTRIALDDEPYTEQVILLPGQGIWYSSPNSADYVDMSLRFNITSSRIFTREEFGFGADWFVFFCPQSLFKMHPLFDLVLADILRDNPTAHVVLTSGRRERWTTVFVERLQKSLGPDMKRCHFISRVSSEKFLQLLNISDVLLHPFPFDGSRTAADGIGMGIPFITLPAEYLRGRMGVSLLRTLNLPELVARNMSDYVRIATQMCNDPAYYRRIRGMLRERADLIWEDMEYPFSWTQFLATVSELSVPKWSTFIAGTGRDITLETELVNRRMENRKLFDQSWGSEAWLLSEDGKVVLPSSLAPSQKPAIFTNWQHVKATESLVGLLSVERNDNSKTITSTSTTATATNSMRNTTATDIQISFQSGKTM